MSATIGQSGGQTGADALISALVGCGVSHVFANPGTSELDLVLALDREPRIKAVPVVFEGVASGAADGFGRMTARPAATLLHLGPGYLNAAANLHNARRARTPLINLVGDHAVAHRRHDAPLASDLKSIVAPHSVWVRDVAAARDMADAAREAVGAAILRRGPVTLIVPADAAWGGCATSGEEIVQAVPLGPNEQAISTAVDKLRAARQPAIFVGGGCLQERGLEACARLAQAGWRVISETFPARQARGAGRFAPERLTYFAEMGQAQLKGTDLLVCIGAKAPVGYFAYPDKPSMHIPEGCHTFHAVAAGECEVEGIVMLADAVGARAGVSPATPATSFPNEGALNPQTIAAAIARQMPPDCIVSDDGVTLSGAVIAATASAHPHDWLCLTGGALGQGLPLAAGAALAAPDRKVLALTGDGAMLYTAQALWTIARLHLDVVIIVAVNRSYEILRYELARMGHSQLGPVARDLLRLDSPEIDYSSMAKALGVSGAKCCDTADFDQHLGEALRRKGPFLIEAICTG